jgi:hypothetical protein
MTRSETMATSITAQLVEPPPLPPPQNLGAGFLVLPEIVATVGMPVVALALGLTVVVL